MLSQKSDSSEIFKNRHVLQLSLSVLTSRDWVRREEKEITLQLADLLLVLRVSNVNECKSASKSLCIVEKL